MQNINSVWALLIVEECLRNGINTFCISPGSRSTFLTSAVARHPKTSAKLFVDERSAAFFALGYAKACGKPAPLICTSGTAVANYFPAVVEASMSKVPMLILSADRPPELRDTGANQTINQPGIFGHYAKWHFDMPCPDEAIPPEMVLTTLDQAIYQATNTPGGTAHLNCMFREPLLPEPATFDTPYLSHLTRWKHSQLPYTSYHSHLPTSSIQCVIDWMSEAKSPFITIGALESPEDIQTIKELCLNLKIPFYGDISSGLRFLQNSNHISYFDQLLLSNAFKSTFQPDVYLHIGGSLVSKRIQQFFSKCKSGKKIIIKNHPFRNDPYHQFTDSIQVPYSVFCNSVLERFKSMTYNGTEMISEANAIAGKTFEAYLNEEIAPDEISVPMIVSKYLHENGALFLSNSMPVRDMDMFGRPKTGIVPVGTNRGASGIDGIISSALGFAHGLNKPTTLVIGDLSAYHDLNAFFQIKSSTSPIVLIIINNGGGGIFSFLPIASQTDIFEPYFETPLEQNFKGIAELACLSYALPKTNREFIDFYLEAQKTGCSTLIEIQTDRRENVLQHKSLQAHLIKQLEANGYPH